MVDKACVACGEGRETTFYLLFCSHYAARVWRATRFLLEVLGRGEISMRDAFAVSYAISP